LLFHIGRPTTLPTVSVSASSCVLHRFPVGTVKLMHAIIYIQFNVLYSAKGLEVVTTLLVDIVHSIFIHMRNLYINCIMSLYAQTAALWTLTMKLSFKVTPKHITKNTQLKVVIMKSVGHL
jgi:hypothetical protein